MSTLIASNKFHVCQVWVRRARGTNSIIIYSGCVCVSYSSAFYRRSLGQIKLNVKSTRYTTRIKQQQTLKQITINMKFILDSSLSLLLAYITWNPLLSAIPYNCNFWFLFKYSFNPLCSWHINIFSADISIRTDIGQRSAVLPVGCSPHSSPL